jgi:flagellar hook-basal body complex protein FliE
MQTMQAGTITSAIAEALQQTGTATEGAGSTPGAMPFSGAIQSAVQSMQQLDQQASAATHGLITGRGVDLHQAMIATQKADTAFELALAVRNKAVGAYQQIMNLQF